MSKVIVHLKGGKSYSTTEGNLENTKRLLGANVIGVEYADQEKQVDDLTEAIDESLVVEVIDENDPSEAPAAEEGTLSLKELENSDKDVLRKLADELAEKKGITKANGRSGVKKLAEYIFNNQ